MFNVGLNCDGIRVKINESGDRPFDRIGMSLRPRPFRYDSFKNWLPDEGHE
jgi:hypothetical protein